MCVGDGNARITSASLARDVGSPSKEWVVRCYCAFHRAADKGKFDGVDIINKKKKVKRE